MRVRTARALAAPVAAALVLAACGGGGGGGDAGATKYDEKGAPVTFTYPSTMTELNVGVREIQGRKPLSHVAIGADDADRVVVETYKLGKPKDQYDPKVFAAAVDRVALTIARAQKPRLQLSQAKAVKLNGLDGYQYALSSTDGVVQRMTFAFRGADQLFVRCVWDPDGGSVKDVQDACAQVEKTVKLK